MRGLSPVIVMIIVIVLVIVNTIVIVIVMKIMIIIAIIITIIQLLRAGFLDHRISRVLRLKLNDDCNNTSISIISIITL